MRVSKVRHEFIELAPPALEPGVLYVSLTYRNMLHLCCCGCGKKVVTPLSPTGWQVSFNGKSVSVYPSIGNWNLECQSHYWIDHGQVEWSESWSKERIAAGFRWDREEKCKQYEGVGKAVVEPNSSRGRGSTRKNFWDLIKSWMK